MRFTAGLCFVAAAFTTPDERLKTAMYLLAYAIFGYEVIINLMKNAVRGRFFDENFLMGIATIGAIALGEYPEAVGVMLFYSIGEYFQELAAGNSRRSIEALIGIKPDTANLVTEKGIVVTEPSAVAVGSEITVKPGERVPIDGVLVNGATSLDMTALTGEAVPKSVIPGDEVLSGSINLSKLIKIRTTKSYQNSTVVRILEAVENASAKKARAERFITKFSRYYTPAVVACAALIALAVPFMTGQPFSEWVHRGLIFLVISCPCALVLSVPLGYFAGLGSCSGKGILVKGGGSLDALTQMKTVVFDKTGTLTQGVFTVAEITPANGRTPSEIIEAAASVESGSNHPLARSITAFYGRATELSAVSGFEETPGFGVSAIYKGISLRLGNAAFIRELCPDFDEYTGAGSVVYIAWDGKYAGYIVVSDKIRETSHEAVSALKGMGVQSIMLTGDNTQSAEAVAGQLGIERVYAGLLPTQKLELLEQIIVEAAGKTAFAGDGINDAPSLARADISIAMGGLGQDAAIEASDIVIMNDNPAKIVEAIIIAKKTRKIVVENIVFSLAVKAAILALAAAGLANMWMAAFADVGVCLLAVMNSMRALSKAGPANIRNN